MASSVNSIESSQLNRFTLSFKDPVLESAFLDEYGKNALRVTLTYLPWIAFIFVIGLGVMMTLFPHLTFLRNFLLGGLGLLVLFFLYFHLLPPGAHFMQLTFSTIGVSLGWTYAYGLIILQGSNLQAYVFVLIIIHTVSVSLALPLRFVYSVVAVHIVWFGFGFVAFFLSNLDTVDALLQLLFLAGLNNICLFATYQREATTRMNFCQRRVIEEREARVTELSEFLKKMFGRYLSTEVMNSLIENPSALELGGERRQVTIMMTDLRGFTALSERLEPEKVVQLLNSYFEVMVEVVLEYNGTINEIIGDALLIIFGAPQEMPDRAQRAIACGIDMQNAMAQINEENRSQGLPELEMGIGLNETEAIVGNIGSSKRSKYAVVGSGVNMTSRIESYTVGGQILISESVRKEAGEVLRIDAQRDVLPKGAETPLRIYEVGGIAGRYNLALEWKQPALVTLAWQIPLRYTLLEGKDIGKKGLEGSVLRLSKKSAEIDFNEPIEPLTNLKMNLGDVDEKLSAKDFYGKVIDRSWENRQTHVVRFTSVPPEVDAYFQALRQYAARLVVS
jgi:class 3 adenylate cyclase